jgi:predicted MFS family arabinose efflux permease
VSGVALSLGPIVGGVLVAGGGWRDVFWFGAGFGLLAIAVAVATVPESSDPHGRRMDWPGLALSATALLAATFAVIEGESAGYGTWWIDALFVLAGAAAVAFVGVERRSRDPLLELEFVRLPAVAAANLVAFAANFALFAVFFFSALYLQLVAGFSGWQIALQFVSLAAAMAVAGVLGGRWTARSGPRAPMVAGCVAAGGGMFAVDALLTPHASIGPLAWALAIVGAGFGLALVTVTAAVLRLARPERSGMAASTLNTSRELGGVFGVAVLGAIVDGQLTTRLSHRLAALGVPPNFRAIVVDAVTHGGVPQTPAQVTNPAARGHARLVAQVLDAAESAFGTGLHICLLLAAFTLLAAGAVALVAPGASQAAQAAEAPLS